MDSSHIQIPGSRYVATISGDILNPAGERITPWQGDKRGHVRVDIDLGRFYVHQLVALTFIGPCPEGQEVRHKNGIYDDNRAANLEYGTRSQNVLDAVAHGTYRNGNAAKTHCPQRHEYTTANTYVDPQGRRRCRKCKSRWVR